MNINNIDLNNIKDTVVLQLPFIIVTLFWLWRVIRAGKRGMIKEICSLISAVVASVSILLIAVAVRSYMKGENIRLAVAVLLVIVLGVIYKLLDLFLTTIKLIAKLPVVNVLDSVLGIVAGTLETLIFVWTVYCMLNFVDVGPLHERITDCINNNEIMMYIYKNNHMQLLLEKIFTAYSNAELPQIPTDIFNM